MKKIYYTCVTNKYDTINIPTPQEGWEYILFTDQDINLPIWNIKKIENRDKIYREIKCRPHIYLPPHDISVWVDGCIEYTGHLDDLINISKDFCLMTHNNRTNLWQEVEACIRLKKDDPDVIIKQTERYRVEKYDGNGLYATGLIIRRNTAPIAIFGNEWWNEIKNNSKRDQLSFGYVAWKQKLDFDTLPFLYNCKVRTHEIRS